MKLIQEIRYRYEEKISGKKIKDVNELMEKERYSNTPFNYFFEMYENNDVVVFANLAGYDFDKNDKDTKEVGRIFQVETAVLAKRETEYADKVFYLNDNDGWDDLSCLNNVPVWTSGDLYKIGIKDIKDSPGGFPYSDFSWRG